MRLGFNFLEEVSAAYQLFRERRDLARKRRIQENAFTWYETCLQISETCGEALFDPNAIPEDIGQVLDMVDLKLFKLRDTASDTLKAVKNHDRKLARRVELVTQLVYKLRNQTTSFLLRAQGPGILAPDQTEVEGMRHWYYLRALDDAGFKARDIKKKLDIELKNLWHELEILLSQLYTPAIDVSGMPN
jgi:hypothetical protein